VYYYTLQLVAVSKTVVFCEILKSAYQKGTSALIVVRGRKLVSQASLRLDREGVPHGVMMAGHWRNQPNQLIQVCSIDTLYARKIVPKASLIVIDEAQYATSNGYTWFTEQYPDAYFLAVTATPYCEKSLRHVASEIVRPITIGQLIEQGFLVAPRYYAPSIPDLTGVRVSQGDFVVSQLDEILNQAHPIGDIVASWKKLGDNRPTLAFGVSVAHSQRIAEAFNAAGIKAAHVDAATPEQEREEAIKKLETGEIKVLTNCGILCVGVDIPAVSCVVMARPTKSYSLYLQVAGRGTRIHPGKKDFIILDHGGNVLRHGLITEDREGSLDPIPKSKKSSEPDLTNCAHCYAVISARCKSCPSCGAENEKYRREDKSKKPIAAELEEADPFHLKVIARRGELRDKKKRHGYRAGWVWHMLKAEFGEDVANKYQPKRQAPDWVRKKY